MSHGQIIFIVIGTALALPMYLSYTVRLLSDSWTRGKLQATNEFIKKHGRVF